MFDIAFSELVVIAVVALIVIGPEKLPKVARTLGMLTGRMQKYVAQIKEEVNRETRFEELQQLQQEIKDATNKTQTSIQSNLQGVAEPFMQEFDGFEITAVSQQPFVGEMPAKTMPTKKAVVRKAPIKKISAKKSSMQK